MLFFLLILTACAKDPKPAAAPLAAAAHAVAPNMVMIDWSTNPPTVFIPVHATNSPDVYNVAFVLEPTADNDLRRYVVPKDLVKAPYLEIVLHIPDDEDPEFAGQPVAVISREPGKEITTALQRPQLVKRDREVSAADIGLTVGPWDKANPFWYVVSLDPEDLYCEGSNCPQK